MFFLWPAETCEFKTEECGVTEYSQFGVQVPKNRTFDVVGYLGHNYNYGLQFE